MDGAAADATGGCSGVGYAFLCRDSTIPKQFEFFAEQSDQRSSASNSDATRQCLKASFRHCARCSIGCLNAVEPGTVVPVHRHPAKDESFVLLRGKVKVSTYNDDGSVLESVVLCQEEGRYGVDIPKNVWHNLEAIEAGSVIFECKEGPFSRLASSNERPKVERVEHEVEGILEMEK